MTYKKKFENVLRGLTMYYSSFISGDLDLTLDIHEMSMAIIIK